MPASVREEDLDQAPAKEDPEGSVEANYHGVLSGGANVAERTLNGESCREESGPTRSN